MAEITQTPGTIIRQCRDRQGLTLEELAAKTASSVAHLSAIERDVRTPSDEVIETIAERLNMNDAERLEVYAGLGVLPPAFKEFVRHNIQLVTRILKPHLENAH